VAAPTVPRGLPLDLGAAAELPAPPDDRAVQQTALVEVGQQRGHGRIHLGHLALHGLEVLLVRVPAAVVDRHVGHAHFHKATGHQATLTEVVATVAIAQGFVLPAQIEYLAGLAEHRLVGRLLGLVMLTELRIARHRLAQRVQVVHELAAVVLALVADALGDDAFDDKTLPVRVAPGRQRLVVLTEATAFTESPLRLGQHDIGRDRALRSRRRSP
jgi:hypothetical protein